MARPHHHLHRRFHYARQALGYGSLFMDQEVKALEVKTPKVKAPEQKSALRTKREDLWLVVVGLLFAIVVLDGICQLVRLSLQNHL